MGLDEMRRSRMLDLVFRDLGMTIARLWVPSAESETLSGMKSKFYSGYVDNGFLGELRIRGVTTFLLAPARGESAPTESMMDYVARIAQFIQDVKEERGVAIQVTGIANEPAGFSPAQLAEAVRELRRELDQRGLSNVGIIAPECASTDACMSRAVDAMKQDSETWNSIQGIASHTYNMGANRAMVDRVIGTGKEYWITEVGRGTPSNGRDEQPGNAPEASVLAARFLNDMNHMVTHWVWFIGVGAWDPHFHKDSGQVLVRPDNTSGGLKIHTKYYYFKQLLSTFDQGSVFRSSSSSLFGTMEWGYGQKPGLVAAAAKNPDGSWGVAVTNITGVENSRVAWYHPAATYKVTIELPIAERLRFGVVRSNATELLVPGTDLWTNDGAITVVLRPNELITARSRSMQPVSSVHDQTP
ncbi:MAG: hypothetical protein LT102_15055 [Burkholderiaceae bacterium]|nr:hypothetical protein [Burkholderiaceae bacterium]